MDLIILLLLIVIVVFVFRDFTAFVYSLGIIEIFLRIIHFVANHLGIAELSRWINTNFPSSIFSILAKYSTGLFYDILCWFLVICFAILEFHLIRYFMKRR